MKKYLETKLNVPENWDKFDYRTQRYSFEDIQDLFEEYKKQNIQELFDKEGMDALYHVIKHQEEGFFEKTPFATMTVELVDSLNELGYQIIKPSE
ncbi:hypothetical protein N9928_01195 [bacterium]|nr:hypothetical protein [bacterium]